MEKEIQIHWEADIKYIKQTVGDIKGAVFGNGRKGLKDRMSEIEVKFWIIIILLVPLAVYSIKEILVR